ncbi:transposase domain-containing protein [Streptomyces malaysiensis]|uniref:transposase domain-containing protein n=1 Tax=Streptomyces TaxID=1883 RepID=UPI0022B794FD|nr:MULTISPECIES: transposase domain-containing protein [Streptomyces]
MLISRLGRLGLGILTQSCPPEMVDRVVGDEGRKEKRRRLLSARFTVYFVLAMCLFPQADYLEVLRLVKAGESTLRPWTGVNKSSLTRARQRLGWTVMRELFRAVARPLGAGPELFCGMRVLALDGTLLAVPGSPGNLETFGKSGPDRGEQAQQGRRHRQSSAGLGPGDRVPGRRPDRRGPTHHQPARPPSDIRPPSLRHCMRADGRSSSSSMRSRPTSAGGQSCGPRPRTGCGRRSTRT